MDPSGTVLYLGNGDVCSPVDTKHIDFVVCRLLRRASSGPAPPEETRLLPCDGFARSVNVQLEDDEPVMRIVDQDSGLPLLSCRWEGIGACAVSPACDSCFSLTIGCAEDLDWTCYVFKCPSRRLARRLVEAVKYRMDNPDEDIDGNGRRSSLQAGTNDLILSGNGLKRTSSLSPRPRPGHEIRRHPSDRLSPVPAARRLSGRARQGSFRRRGDEARRLKSLPCIAALSINMSLLVRQFQTVSGDAKSDADLLKLACESNDVNTVSRVLDAHYDLFNVDYNVTTSVDGEPNRTRKISDSLTVQVLLNQSKALIGQLEKGVDADEAEEERKAAPNVYHNALHLAVLNGSADVVRLLLKCGVDPNSEGIETADRYRKFSEGSDGSESRGSSGKNAASPEHRERLSSSTIRDYFGKPVLFLAVRMGNAMVVKMLLNYGARVDGKDLDGRTALHIAASALNDRWECAVQLIEFGAKILDADDDGHRPVDSAPGLALLQLRVVQDTLEVFNPRFTRGGESPRRRSSGRDSRKVSLGLLAIPRLVARVTRSRSPANKERSNTVAYIPSAQTTIAEGPEEEATPPTDSFYDKRVRKTSLWGWFDRRRKSRDEFKHVEDQCESNSSSSRTLGQPQCQQQPMVPQEILVNGENIESGNVHEEDTDCEAFATDRSLLVLQRLSTNPECLCALLDRLPTCINKLIGLAESLGGHLRVFLGSLLTNLLQATTERWSLQIDSREEREHVLTRSEVLNGLFRLAVPCVACHGSVCTAALGIIRFVLERRLRLEEGSDDDDDFFRLSNRDSKGSRTSSGFEEEPIFDRRSVARCKSDETARGHVIRRDRPGGRSLKWIGRPASVAVDTLVGGHGIDGYSSPNFPDRSSGSYGWEREVEQRLQSLKQRLLSNEVGIHRVGALKPQRIGSGCVRRRRQRGRFSRGRAGDAYTRRSTLVNVRLALKLLASIDVALLLDCLKNIAKSATKNIDNKKMSASTTLDKSVDDPPPSILFPGAKLDSSDPYRDVCQAQMLSAKALLTISSLPTTRRALMRPEYLWRLLGVMEPHNDKRFLCLLLQVVETLTLEPSNHAALLAAGLAYRLEKIYRDALSLKTGHGKMAEEKADCNQDVLMLRIHTTRVMVYLGLLELVGGYNRDGTNLLEMEAEFHRMDSSPLYAIQPVSSSSMRTHHKPTAFETLLHKVPHQSLERMVAIAICLHGNPDKCNSRIIPQDDKPTNGDNKTGNTKFSNLCQQLDLCSCTHCQFQDSLLETLSMCLHPVILLRVVEHVLLALININEGWGRKAAVIGGAMDDKKHIQIKVLCLLQRWCILIPEDFIGDQAVRKEASVLLRRLGTLGSCKDLNHVTKRVQLLTCRPQPSRSFKEPHGIRKTSRLRSSVRSLQHSASSFNSLRLLSTDSDQGSPVHRGKLSVSSIGSTVSGGRHSSLTSKASSNGSLNTMSSIATLPVIDKQIINMPLKDLDSLYNQLCDKIHKETLPCTQEIAVRLAALHLVVDRANTSPDIVPHAKLVHDEPFNNNALSSSSLNLITTQDDSVFVDSTKRHGVNFDMETVILDDDPKADNRSIDNGSPWKSHGSPRLMRENRFDWGSSSESSFPNSPDHHSALMASKEVLRTSLPQGITNVRQVQKATKKCFRNYVDMLADIRDPKERAVKAKQLYVELCRHMPSYGSKVFQVKELSGNRIRKKVARILCISAHDICLLQPSTKAIFRSTPTHLLNNWCISSFKAGSGQLVLEFRGGARKWTLQPATFPELKAICATLSAVMQEVSANGGLLADVGPISRSTPASPSSGAHHSIMPPLTSLTTTTYQEEFEHCKQMLHFPEEVALILTDTEHQLFSTVPCGSYVRHVTNPGSTGMNQSQCSSEEYGSKTVKDLILRFREVSDWVTETVTAADHDDKMTVLTRYVQIANCCWNMGNFNAVMEILEGLRSIALKPLLENADELGSESFISLYDTINNNTTEYRDAVDKALCIPGCKVVPYFGVFLHELERIYEDNTPTISLPGPEEEDSAIEGGVLCTDKMLRASLVLSDIRMCQQATRQQREENQSQLPQSDEEEEDQDTDQSQSDTDQSSYITCFENEVMYEPINPIPNPAGIEIIPHHRLDNHLHTVQCMHHGLTVIHWEDDRSAICVLKLDPCNSVLTWAKSPDSDVDADLLLPPTMCNVKYHSTIPIQGSLEEGYLELSAAKQVFLGHDTPDLGSITRRHGMSGNLSKSENCISILFGTCITDNRLVHFVAPKRTIDTWYAGLTAVLNALQEQSMYVADQRIGWLEKEYLNLFYSKKNCYGPTPLDAIRSFGGHNALMKKPSEKSEKSSLANSAPDSPITKRSFHHFKPVRKLAIKQKSQPSSPKVDDGMHSQFNRRAVRKTSSIKVKHKKKMHQRSHTTDLTGRSIFMPNGEDSRSSSFDSSEPLRSMSADSTSMDMSDTSIDNKQDEDYSSGERLGSLSSSLSKTDDSISYETPPLLRQKSSSLSLTGSQNLITTHSNLSFPEFVELFKSFSLRCRKDLKDIFDSYSVTFNPKDSGKDSALASLLRTKEDVEFPTNTILSLTRNTFIEPLNESNRRVSDAIAASSVQANSTGVQTVTTHVMGVEEMKQFLGREQEEEVPDEEILQIIQRHEPSALVRDHQCISFEGFARFMMDRENYAFNNEQQNVVKQDLTHPMTHYWISSSHNTYLTGHQLKGESSVELYAQVLLTGCRCVELDCWDGDDGSPVIYHGLHGHTLTTKISFKGVVEAINRAAFIVSDYPVILSIENHCSLQQQVKMAQIFIDVFGERLVTKFMFDSDFGDNPRLPSPEQLKGRILIKNKKLKPNQIPPELLKHRMIKLGKQLKATDMLTASADISEEEDYPEEFYEEAYDYVEEHLTDIGDDKSPAGGRLDLTTDGSDTPDEGAKTTTTIRDSHVSEGGFVTLSRKISSGTTSTTLSSTGNQKPSADDSATHQQQPLSTSPASSTPVKSSKKRKDTSTQQIAADLSNLVIYTQAIKFTGFGDELLTTQKQKGSRKGSKGNVPSSTGPSPGSPSTGAKDAQAGGDSVSPGQEKTAGDMLQQKLLQMPKCYHCSSINENNLKRLFRKFSWRFIEHTEYQLMRTYPAGMRIDSSNFNPIIFWAFGIQLVALNYQTEDANLTINATLFEQTGNCGYVLKPSFLWDKNDPLFRKFNAYDKTIDGLAPKELTISIVSGQFLCPNNPTTSPYVEVEVMGIPSDCAKWKTKPILRNAINPIWDEAFTFHIACQDLAFLRLCVFDGTGSGVIAQRCIPVKSLKTGFRHVRLRSPNNAPLDLPSMFIHTRLEEVQDMVSKVISENQRKRQMLSDMLHYHIGKEKDDKMEFSDIVDGKEMKRTANPVVVYGIVNANEATTLKAVQETKVHEIIAQALGWGDRSLEEMTNYSLVEEVQETWEEDCLEKKAELGTSRIEERTLELEERILEAESTWTGRGRFILKFHGERHRSDEWSGEGDPVDKTFLVWVYNVSTEQPYTVFRALTTSTAQDIIAQAMAKAKRLDTDPSNFWLVEEVYKEWRSTEPSAVKKDITDKVTSRVLGDDENVYEVQNQWKTPGRFTLKERDESAMQGKGVSSTGFAFRRLASMRSKKQLLNKGRPITPPPLAITGKKASTLPNDFKPGDVVKNGATTDQSSESYTPPPRGAMAAKSNFVVKIKKWKAGSGKSDY